jgi:hypothetical protein
MTSPKPLTSGSSHPKRPIRSNSKPSKTARNPGIRSCSPKPSRKN